MNQTIKGESDGDQHNSPHQVVNVENVESSSSGYESLTTERTLKAVKETQAKIEFDKAAMIEPATVADYLSQPYESSPEKGTHKDSDLGFKTPPFGDPIEPVDQSLVEVASELNSITKMQEKNDLVGAETRLEHTVVSETDSKNNQLLKENEVQKLGSKSDKASPKSKKDLLQDSRNGKCRYCGRGNDDHVNEPVIPDCSERQPLLASAPRPSEKASWKNCCGIFELFSGFTRYNY
ncbi:hypothetical protein L1987_57147 [Smallanthus sonchifolius]|uniref:Uncharacterized protein n=1 Tax=Smallanthus sonchifolius TaxID=185202 RepID=A0ACB9DBT4_9ASTR|nr:hypothetical protein L1987_57147 [Smallanthus sonchifolius]